MTLSLSRGADDFTAFAGVTMRSIHRCNRVEVLVEDLAMRHCQSLKLFSVAASLVLFALTCRAATITASPADYRAKLAALTAGDILELQAGRYTAGLPVHNLTGTSAAPIVIRGPASGARAIIEGTTTTNVVQLRGSAFVTIQNLEVDGMGRVGDGVNSDSNGSSCSHDITIENFYIHDQFADQQIVGISTNGCISWNWTIRGNRIERAGTGMYLGSSTGNQQFFNGIVEYNVVVDTIGYNIEFKQQNVRPTITGMPTQDARTIVRHNVFSKSGNSSTGGDARPNLLVGHMPSSGPGVNDRYEIYGNFFFQNPTEVLFQGEGNIYFYDNVLFNSHGTAVSIQPHNNVPRDVHIFNNTIVAADSGIRISGGAAGFVQEAFANAVFAATPLSVANARDNVVGSFAGATTYLNNPSTTIALLDLYPKNAQLSGAAISYGSVISPPGSLAGGITEYLKDFNGTTQPGTARGAYVYAGSSTNPGWKLALARKPPAGVSLPTAPTLTFSGTPTTVALNGVAQLTWSSSNADACIASGAWSGSKALQGAEQAGPLTTGASYTLTCSNAGGDVSRTVAIDLFPAPTVSLTANPVSVTAGNRTTLSWSTANAQTCSASGAWAGNKSLGPDSEQSAVLNASSTFTLSCTGSGGTVSSSTTVAVTAAPAAPPPESESGGGAMSVIALAAFALLALARRVSSTAKLVMSQPRKLSLR